MYRILGLLFVLFPYCILCASADYSNQGSWSGQCNDANSKRQSPIDIPCKDFIQVCPSNITYKVHWENPVGSFGGSTSIDLTTPFAGNSWVQFTNSTNSYLFKSLQFHLHAPSEHTVNGKQYQLQLHIVHTLDITPPVQEFLVIGIFFEVDPSLTYDFLDYVKINSATASSHLFPFPVTNSQAYHYLGSLTTPICAEKVNWFVQVEPVKVTRASMDSLKASIAGGSSNSRLVQALNNRPVYLVGKDC